VFHAKTSEKNCQLKKALKKLFRGFFLSTILEKLFPSLNNLIPALGAFHRNKNSFLAPHSSTCLVD